MWKISCSTTVAPVFIVEILPTMFIYAPAARSRLTSKLVSGAMDRQVRPVLVA
jgi:hypothetical protein